LVCRGGFLASRTVEPIALQRRKHTNVCNKQLILSLLSLLPCLPYGVMPLVSKEISGVDQVVQTFFIYTKKPRNFLKQGHMLLQNLCGQHGPQNRHSWNAKCGQGGQVA